jgi:hypothetical protein
MAKAVVWLTGLFFVIYGAAFVIAPVEMASLVTGGSPITSSGLIDLRATYGGMSIAVGSIICLLAMQNMGLSLLFTGIVLLAMAAARIVGIVIDTNPNTIMIVYLVAELAAGCAALGLRKANAPN